MPYHPYVIVDGKQVPINDYAIEFITIEEDLYGRDVMTFIYNGKEYQSLIFIS
jgi:hypothetical protein